MRISDWSSDVCSSDLEVEENEDEYEPVTNVDSGLQSIAVSQPAATSPDSVNDVPISAPANAAPNAAPAAAPVTETRGTCQRGNGCRLSIVVCVCNCLSLIATIFENYFAQIGRAPV